MMVYDLLKLITEEQSPKKEDYVSKSYTIVRAIYVLYELLHEFVINLSCFLSDCSFHACSVMNIFKISDTGFMHGEGA
jgi:hypothetical protein